MRGFRAIVATVMVPLLLVCGVALGQETAVYPKVETSVMPTSGTVGEHFHLLIRATVPDATKLQVLPLFDIQTSWTAVGDPKIIDSEQGSEHSRNYDYTIVPFETGRLEVPQVAFTYNSNAGSSSTVHSKPLWVEVNSVLSGNGSASALRDVKPPVSLPLPAALVWTVGIVLLLVLLFVGWLLWRRYAQRLRKFMGRSLSPPELALKQMETLETERLVEHKKIKEYYTRLSDTVREYLQEAYGVQAMDLTSNELIRALDEMGSSEKSVHADNYRKAMAQLVEMLDEADLVKFARLMPEAGRCKKALNSGREIIMLTRYKFETPEEEQAKNSGGVRPPAPPPDNQNHGSVPPPLNSEVSQ